ncbi:hypothetical protein Trydic_g18467 [Trypoxylus dichotomus]
MSKLAIIAFQIGCLSVITCEIMSVLTMFERRVSERELSSDVKAIVRVCVDNSRKQYIACLGVSIHPRWIFASKSCNKDVQNNMIVELYTGSTKMDCRSGQLRYIKNVIVGKNIMYIKPHAPFTQSSQISTMPVLKDKAAKLSKCVVFCSQRVIRYKQGQNPNIAMCHPDLWSQGFDLVPCRRKINWNSRSFSLPASRLNNSKSAEKFPLVRQILDPATARKQKGCGSIVEKGTPSDVKQFETSMAPIVCKHKLAGFVKIKQTNPYIIKFKGIGYSVQEINVIMNRRCQ